MFAVTLLFVFLGTGCARTSITGTSGASAFGRLVGGSVTESAIKGGWVRPHPGPFWWDQIETSQDVYDWSKADETVKYWQERDQAILATLWPFAQWDQARCRVEEPKVKHPFSDEQVWLWGTCHVESYEEWIRNVVERYDGDETDDMPDLKYPITHWEIGNEPDLQTPELTFFQRGPIAYEELYRLGYAAIKSADPGATVLLAGMASISPNSYRYWREIFLANRQWGDIANIHSIQEGADFNAKLYREYLNGLGNESHPFWVTEALVGSKEEEWDEDKKAQMTLIGYASAFANGAQKVFNVGKHDPTGGPGEQSEATFDLVVETLNGFESVERLSDMSVMFEFSKKKTVYALWNDAILPEEVKGNVEIVRYDGTRERARAKDIKAEKPMFVIVK